MHSGKRQDAVCRKTLYFIMQINLLKMVLKFWFSQPMINIQNKLKVLDVKFSSLFLKITHLPRGVLKEKMKRKRESEANDYEK